MSRKDVLGKKTTTRDNKDLVKREKYLASYSEIPRPIISVQEKIREIGLHLFGDASTIGTSPVAYMLLFNKSQQQHKGLSHASC